MQEAEIVNSKEVSEDDSEEVSQFLTFNVDESEYAVDIMKVMEIRGWTETTRIPNSPDYMRGVINLRGLVIPIFDLKSRFGQGHIVPNEKNVVIVISIESRTVGILVDAVSDILSIKEDQIKASPSSNNEMDIKEEYVKGLISHNDKMVVSLDVDTLFHSEEVTKEKSLNKI